MSDSDDNPAYEDEFALGAEDEDDDKGGIISGGYVEEIEDSSSSSAPEKDTRIRRSRRSRVSVASTNPKYTEASSSDEDVQGEGKHSDIEEYNGEEEVERSESKNARGSSPRKKSSSLHSPATKEKEIPSRRSRRARVSAKSANPKYKGSVTSHDDDVEYDENISEDEDKVGQELEDEGVRKNTKRSSPRKRSSSSKSPAKKSAQSKTTPPKSLKLKAEDDIEMKYAEKDEKPSSKAINSRSNESIVPAENEGVDIVIPHSLLNNSRQSRKECNVLVQVEPNDEEASMHLDFIGQSGAIGRFEADENGVILDLKGYQYRGTIRPGPTAMVVALTRDGKLKVESITDEFVTLDTNTRTDVMAKLDAVVEGDMDDGYVVRDDNVNDNKRGGDNSNKGKKGSMADSDQNDDGKGKMRKKRVSAPKSSGGGAAKKKRVSSMKKK